MHYEVADDKLRLISLLGDAVAGFSSVASALLAVAISIGVGIALSDTLTTAGEILGEVVAPILGVVSLFFFGCAYRCRTWLDRELKAIRTGPR